MAKRRYECYYKDFFCLVEPPNLRLTQKDTKLRNTVILTFMSPEITVV